MEQIEEQPPQDSTPPNPINEEVVVTAPEPEAVVNKGEEDDPSYDPSTADADVDAEEEVEVKAVKRKRGRPRKIPIAKPPAKKQKNEDEKRDEDVCFICFDGGNLVCCDRRGCPKVYHAACVNREEEFLTKGKWNCGWHICSICEKAAQYLCCTCSYSLCRGCIKNAEFICVRGKKGFCQNCYNMVMLIESKSHDNDEKVGVNFNDKASFEYLFREYWLDVQRKLSLEVEELQNAKAQLNRLNAHNKASSSDESYTLNNDKESSSDSSSRRRRNNSSSKKKSRRRPQPTIGNNSSPVQKICNFDSQGDEWASEELLEFVSHMKGGDKSPLSQFDVQALLLEYIKHNNLRDPRKKSQIICDKMLENLFGKARVGHFEMLKLLELHFPGKEVSHIVTDDNQGANVELGPGSGQVDEAYIDGITKLPDKRRKGRKKNEDRDPQTNLDEYAAIDVHNISLIFLRRNLIENLLDDVDTFTDNVVGSFVRIRIPGTGKQEMYRLVQVVGTPKAAEKYKTGKKTTYFMLEVQNLNKKESMTINDCSNQDFTEEECKRLRQSIKFGLLSRFTVGDIQEKAMALQVVRVNEGLESEKQRLSHLRDRASETGRRKELRECVEKLQLLNTPEERTRRMNQIPEIHADPKMDPENESDDEEEKSPERNPVASSRPRELSFRKDKYIFPPTTPASSKWISNKSTRESNILDDKTDEPPWTQQKDVIDPSVWNNDTSTNATAPPLPPPPPDDTKEKEKIWNYRDPVGNVQGPFSMIQLRKWNTTGLFPVGMKIWRASETEDESILLSDALNGNFEKDLPQWELPVGNSQPTTGLAQNFSTISLVTNPLDVKNVLSPMDASTLIGQLQPQIQNILRPITPTYGNQYGSWSSNNPVPPQPIIAHQGYGPSNQWVSGMHPQGLFHAAATPTQAVPQQSVAPPWRTMNVLPQPPPPGTHSVNPSWGPVNAPPPPPPPPGSFQPPMNAFNGNWGGSGFVSVIPNMPNQIDVPNAPLIPSNQLKSNFINAVSTNKFFESDCPSPTPTNERLDSTETHNNVVNRVAGDNMSPIRDLDPKPASENTGNINTWSMPSPTPGIAPSSNRQSTLSVPPDAMNSANMTSSQRGWGTWQERLSTTPNTRDENSSISWNKANQADINLWGKGEDPDLSRYGRDSSRDASQHVSYSRRDSRYDDRSRRDSRYDDRSRRDSRYEDEYSRHNSRHREDSRRDSRYGGYERAHHDRRGRRSRTPPKEGKSQGICKFHEGGHCKKGASCNYAHP